MNDTQGLITFALSVVTTYAFKSINEIYQELNKNVTFITEHEEKEYQKKHQNELNGANLSLHNKVTSNNFNINNT